MYSNNRIYGKCGLSQNKAHRGFSLIELIIVVAIMATLVGLIAPQYVRYVRQKRITTCKHNREAILRIYERAVYDGSTPILLDNDSIQKVVDLTYKPTAGEVEQYLSCPVNESDRTWHAYISADGSACIECEHCGNIGSSDEGNVVSIDMLGWSGPTTTAGVDNVKPTPVYPTPTVDVDETYTVTFNLQGRGTPKPEDQTDMKRGDKVARPTDPKATTYTFEGWYKESGCVNKWDFANDTVQGDTTLYAKWEGLNASGVWPYADDPTWWDPDLIDVYHAGEYDKSNTNLPRNDSYRGNAKIGIWTPSGIFTSRTGAQFVFVDTQGNGSAVQLELKNAGSPEYYAAVFSDRLVQLTGNKTVIDITGVTSQTYLNWQNPGEYKLEQLTQGDLVEFVDDGVSYLYVYWEGQGDKIINIESIRSYPNHPQGLYRVNKTPTTS